MRFMVFAETHDVGIDGSEKGFLLLGSDAIEVTTKR